MTPTPASRARMLLRLSRNDADVLKFAVEDRIAGFHAQQSIEKAMKAILTICGVDYPFIHSLPQLADMIAGQDIALPKTPYRFADLTEYAVSLRYDEPPEPRELDRGQLSETTEIFLAFAEYLVASKAGDAS